MYLLDSIKVCVLGGLFLLCTGVFAETLEDLEKITARYPTLSAFLDDSKAVEEYREALKAYMGEDYSFNEVYDNFISQIRDVSSKVRGFSEQAWVPNSQWKEEAYFLKGELRGTGLKINLGNAMSELNDAKIEVHRELGSLYSLSTDDRKKEIKRISAALIREAVILPESELLKLSRRDRAAYNAKLNNLSSHPTVKLLSDYAFYELYRTDEVGDALNSGDADVITAELRKLERASNYKATLRDLQLGIPEDLIGYLKFEHPTITKILTAYKKGLASMKEFQSIGYPRLDPAVRNRLEELRAMGVSAMILATSDAFRSWNDRHRSAGDTKKRIHSEHNAENPFFTYDVYENEKNELKLKAHAGLELHFKPTPRPFHAFFAGRKKGECVGGRSCSELTPRRWARAALKGSQTLFTETGNGKMEGFIGLTELKHSDGKIYHAVDIMSHAIKGDVVVKREGSLPVKYSFFDFFIDNHPMPQGSSGLVISDGTSVKMNVGAQEVVRDAPAYLQGKSVGAPEDFSPRDSLAKEITRQYPNGHYPVGIIHDGMLEDGTKITLLVPSEQNAPVDQDELDSFILKKLMAGRKISERDGIWKLKRKSGVRIQPASYYHSEGFRNDVYRRGNAENIFLAGEFDLAITDEWRNFEKATERWKALALPLPVEASEDEFRHFLRVAFHFPSGVWARQYDEYRRANPNAVKIFYLEFAAHPARDSKMAEHLFHYALQDLKSSSPELTKLIHNAISDNFDRWTYEIRDYAEGYAQKKFRKKGFPIRYTEDPLIIALYRRTFQTPRSLETYDRLKRVLSAYDRKRPPLSYRCARFFGLLKE